ncbi:uncharacterized protein B0H18DRAFT_56917 [Fomitopsis serialis]|uniref:uncharacterized protein n=1 Tax=Fomitopsis serialis TaxID=139415 RepID=UPI0020077394|nr:uncharacterized protein B0H18DRAFT_56917 [Neoantrodia serialis]KAH9916879.1 hypothetical protein B0H18DRAFT_56917 [Neoantrodia serialis]
MDGTGYEHLPTRHDVLNADIWSMILSFVDLADAPSLSLVSRAIHPHARRIVLSCADIFQQDQLTRACAFLLDDPHHRACWLRELHIDGDALQDLEDRWESAEGLAIAAQLAELLHAAQNIHTLALPHVESLLEVDAGVGAALISLKQLQVVSLSGILTGALDVANKMASRPTEVYLNFASPSSSYDMAEYFMLLSHLTLFSNAHTVEVVFFDISRPDRFEKPSDFSFEIPQLGQHSTVREVGLRYSGPLPLFHIFPNMEVLRMRCMDETFENFDWQDWAWTESVPLVDVTADDDDQLVCLAGARPPTLRQLHLHAPPLRSPEGDFSVDDLRPVCLAFPLQEWQAPWNYDIPIWAGHLEATPSPEFGSRLRYLEVTPDCHTQEDMPASWVEWLLPALRESTLVCVRLNFNVDTPSGTVTKLDEVRRTLVENVASLRYICIAVGRIPQSDLLWAYDSRVEGECTWWRVRGKRASTQSASRPRPVSASRSIYARRSSNGR